MRGLVAVMALAGIAAADPGAQAEELYREYLQVRTKPDRTRHRAELLRKLGRLDAPQAREALSKVLRATRSRDERVVAVLSLGAIADRAAAAAMLEGVARRPEPALVEALAEALGRVADADARAFLATEAFAHPKPEVLYAVALAQRELAMPEAAPALVALYAANAGHESTADLAAAAVRGLAAVATEDGRETLAAAAAHADGRIRLAAAEDPDLAPALLDDPVAAVRQEAAATCARAKREDAVPSLLRVVEADPRLRSRDEAARALEAISGKRLGLDAPAWRRWWKDRTGEEAKPGTVTVARYYSFPVHSDRLLFVVDVSGSMTWPWSERRPKRIEVARAQLRKVVKGIDPKSLFNLLVFASRVEMWQPEEFPADPANVERALAWADRALSTPEGETFTYDALERAFTRNPHFDTVYFLSDGYPSDGDYKEPEGLLCSVAAWNRDRRARVYTIALTLENVDRGRPNLAERPELMRRFMTELARRTGGEHAWVSTPPPD